MIVINGEQGDAIHAMDRAVMYGDGVFRTMRIREGHINNWLGQYRKLHHDCQSLDILCPARDTLEREIKILSRSDPNSVLKIIITRGEGGRGYRAPSSIVPNRVLLTSATPQYPAQFWYDGVQLFLCDIRLSHQPRLAGIKHLNRLENVLARMEWDNTNIPEGLLLDAEDWVIEGTMSNIFLRQGNMLRTPNLSACGVAGLQRDRIMRFAPSLALSTEITQLCLQDFLQADEVFVSNSVIGVWPVRRIGEHDIPLGPVAVKMQQLLAMEDA